VYLRTLLKDNLSAISSNIKLQLKDIRKWYDWLYYSIDIDINSIKNYI